MNAQTNSKKTAGPGRFGRLTEASVYAAAALTLGFIWPPGFVDVSYQHGELLLLLISIALMAAAAILLIRNTRRRSDPSFGYYGLGLALIGLGLADAAIAAPGGVLSWTGRICQYGGYLYALAVFMAAIRIALHKGMDVQEAAAEYYLESKDHYRTLVNALRAAVISIDPKDRVILWNPKAEAIFGYTHAEVTGKPLPELLAAGGADRETLRHALKGRPERYLDMKLRRKGGAEFPADVMVFAAGGGWKQWTNLIIRDATDRKLAEQALHRERGLLDVVMQATDVMLVYLDRDFNLVWVNHAYAETCRMRPGELIGKNHFALYPHAENQAIFSRVRDTGEPVFFKDKAFEFPDQPERGVTYWDWSLVPAKDEAGRVQGLVFSLRETTKYKQAELALAESGERLRLAHTAASLGMWMHDVAADTVYLDARAQEHYGAGPVMPLVEIVARIHLDDRPSVAAMIRAALDPATAEDRVVADYRVLDAGGAVRWLSIAGRVVFEGEAAARRAVRVYGASQDITERKTAEQALRHSEEALRQTNERLEEIVRQRTAQLEDTVSALKNEVVVRRKIQTQLHQLSRVFMDAADPIIIEDLSGTIIEMNREAEIVYGWSRDELIGKPIATLFLPERCHLAEQLRERCRRGEEIRDWEGVRKARSGRIIPSLLTAFPLMDESNKIAFVATISKDISARKEMEARLKDSQRHLQDLSRKSLEALEADRRTVSRELHDSIGGSLAAIKFGLEAAAAQDGQDPGCRATSLETIISHLADTIKETKRISANLRPLTLDDLGLLATIDSYSRQFSQRYGNIRLVREIEVAEQDIPDEFKIVLYRVMQEALTNAAKHSNADTVHIRLRREDVQVVFEVEDNGCGFSANEVFGRKDGLSGFGLKSMQERAEICDGIFAIQSRPGAGTCIRVRLHVGGPEAALKAIA